MSRWRGQEARAVLIEGMLQASRGRGDGIIDAATVAMAADRAVGVPAFPARLRNSADAEALAAVIVGEAGQDLLG